MDLDSLSEALELAGSGLKATDSIVATAGRIKGLFQSSQPSRDEDIKSLIADLTLQIADAKLANAELKIKLSQMLEAQISEQQSKSLLSTYTLTRTTNGGITYTPNGVSPDDPQFHQICPTCYEDGKRTILQSAGRDLECPRCKTMVPNFPMSL